MGYDLHIVRTEDWTEAANVPVTKQDVDNLIANDPELKWSTTDFVEMAENGTTTRYYMIIWRGLPCFWWYRDQISCSGPSDAHQLKLAQMARALNAFVIGDEDERYEIRKSIFGEEKLVVVPPDS